MKRNDLVGQTFGRLTVTSLARISEPKQNAVWGCACACGGMTEAFSYDLKKGKVKSCGCLIKEGFNKVHGMARAGASRSKTYSVWAAMIQRCTNVKDATYKHYGARGIGVADKWRVFLGFYEDMGECPPGLTLERKDNAKGYEKITANGLPQKIKQETDETTCGFR